MRRSEQMGARVTHIVPRGTARRCSGCGSRTEAEHCIGPAILPPCSVTASESWGGAVAVGPSPAARQGHRGRPCLGRVVQTGNGRSGSSGRGRCAFSQNPMTENWGVTSSSAAEALAPPLDPSAPAHASVALHVLPLEGPC
jgi:hypothetical protein